MSLLELDKIAYTNDKTEIDSGPAIAALVGLVMLIIMVGGIGCYLEGSIP